MSPDNYPHPYGRAVKKLIRIEISTCWHLEYAFYLFTLRCDALTSWCRENETSTAIVTPFGYVLLRGRSETTQGKLAFEPSDSDIGQPLTIVYLAWPAGYKRNPVCQFPFMCSGSQFPQYFGAGLGDL